MDKSPTAPLTGVKLFTSTSVVYEGVVAEATVPFAVMIVTVPIVPNRLANNSFTPPAP